MCKCKVCGATSENAEFYSSNKSYCKTHLKERVKANRAANSDYYNEADRARSNLPHRVAARSEYQKTDAFVMSHNKAIAKYQENNEERRKAQVAVGNAVRDGRLVAQPCFLCGIAHTEAHHADYSAPLDVVWLCVAHHKEVHQEAKELLKAA